MSKTRRHFTLDKKVEIIEELNKGKSVSQLARLYDVSVSVIVRIKKNSEKILKLKRQCGVKAKGRKTVAEARHSKLDEACYIWFVQKRNLHQPISGSLLCAKALEFNKKLGGPETFKASAGWLRRFKKRRNIKQLSITGEKLSSDEVAASDFKETCQNILNEGYDLCDIYNADETGVFWKMLPKRTLTTSDEKTAPGIKTSKQRLTVLLCSNADGSHKIPLLVIGKSQKPRDYKQIEKLPLYYKGQKNGWINTKLFVDWYTNIFIKEVKNFKNLQGNTRKTLLIIDNAPSHSNTYILNKINENFTVIFLPPKVTALIQPMDQGIISVFKRFYRKYLLQDIIMQDSPNKLSTFFRNTQLNNACFYLWKAWETTESTTIRNCWKILFPLNDKVSTSDTSAEINLEEMKAAFKQLEEYQNLKDEHFEEWISCDKNDIGYALLTDDQIIQSVTAKDENDSDIEEIVPPISAEHAYSSFMEFYSWFQTQEECSLELKNALENVKTITYGKIMQNKSK